jgi:hypothetical protein
VTGPEHYQAAEHAIAIFDEEREPGAWQKAIDSGVLALATQVAHVHATLALAAAVAFSADMTAGEWPGWRDAAASETTKAE